MLTIIFRWKRRLFSVFCLTKTVCTTRHVTAHTGTTTPSTRTPGSPGGTHQILMEIILLAILPWKISFYSSSNVLPSDITSCRTRRFWTICYTGRGELYRAGTLTCRWCSGTTRESNLQWSAVLGSTSASSYSPSHPRTSPAWWVSLPKKNGKKKIKALKYLFPTGMEIICLFVCCFLRASLQCDGDSLLSALRGRVHHEAELGGPEAESRWRGQAQLPQRDPPPRWHMEAGHLLHQARDLQGVDKRWSIKAICDSLSG